MASNYTCRACSRALSRPSSALLLSSPRKTALYKIAYPHRNLSTSKPTLYQATAALAAAAAKTPPPPPPPPPPSPKKSDGPPKPAYSQAAGLAEKIREQTPVLASTYMAYGATEQLIKECARTGEYTIPQSQEKGAEIPRDETGAHLGVGKGWWYETLGLAPTFISWAQITFIHMYMLQVRFRMFPKDQSPLWIQHITNHAFYAAEDRLVVWHQLNANSLRQKYLKDMFAQWRAVLLSYDEGLIKGDAVLAAAIWRNLFAAREEDMDFEKLAMVVGYMRRELKRLDAAPDGVVASGVWKFESDPGMEANVVKAPSRMATEAGKAVASERLKA